MTSKSRVSIGGLLACALVGLNLLMANPAQANETRTEDCSIAEDRRTDLTLTVGQTLTIDMDGTCDRIVVGAGSKGEVTVTQDVGGAGETRNEYDESDFPPISRLELLGRVVPAVVVYTATEVGEAFLQVFKVSPSYAGHIWNITVVAAPDPPPTNQGPAPLIQQFGKPDAGSCEDVAPPDLNWAGVASGGWSESWAQWMHDGNGGAVCTRTLEYHQGHSRWMVN